MSFFIDKKVKEFYLLLIEIGFIEFDGDIVFLEDGEYLSEVFVMIFLGRRENYDVIEITDDEGEVVQKVIHCLDESFGCIRESKRNSCKFILFRANDKRSVLLVLFLYHYLIISGSQIDL